MTGPRYAELQVTSHFSFLRGASSCEELFATAAALGIEALAIVDRNSLAGIVRAHEAAKTTGVRLVVVGCRLDLTDSSSMLVYPTDRPAYSRLCRLLSLGKKRGGKAKCELAWSDLVAYGEGLIAVLVPDSADDDCALRLRRLREAFGDRAYVALSLRRRPNDQLRLHEFSNLAAQMRVATVVTNDVLFHEPVRRIMQDVVTCIRHGVTIDELGDRRERHADRYLKPPDEMHRLFGRYPEALARTLEIVERCRFSLGELAYQYPEERAWEGAAQRYPEGLPDKVQATLQHELRLIEKLQYAPYFLTVNSIVRFARSKDILCQGRGSAANSAVCYVLGITSIDPDRNDLLFERFVSEERREPPDIDVDFEHERREIVMQWIFETYGRDHAALCSTVIRYRTKGALRDVGKALGLTEDLVKMLSSQVWGWSEDGVEDKHVEALNLNLSDRRLRLTLDLARQLMGAPRHLSQHPGGFVLTNDRLDDLVPIEPAAMVDRQVIEWDKDDIDILRFMKVDVLALGMLTCMKRAFDFLADHKAINLDLATIPAEDPRTYAMIRKADTLGTFQIESRAQMSMLPREAARQIARRLADWSPSIFLGYNSIPFDEELLRQTFYQTLQPIYLTNTSGNTRGDILNLVNASTVVAPTALTLPIGTSGKPSRKLDALAPANGYDHAKAHDALADVEATIFLAKVIRAATPALWEEFLHLRSKRVVTARLNERGLFFLTEFYGTTPVVIPLAGCGTAPGADSLGCAFDLRYDPREYLMLGEEELLSVMTGRKKALRYVPCNKQPMLLFGESSFALPYAEADRDEFRSRADLIYRSQDFRARACRVLGRRFSDRPQGIHVEQRIHEQFLSTADATLLSYLSFLNPVGR